MRIVSISLLVGVLASVVGCFSLHATVPEDAVRRHVAREEGVEIGAICSFEGRSFSEGATVCMSGRRTTCDATGRWAPDGDCAS